MKNPYQKAALSVITEMFAWASESEHYQLVLREIAEYYDLNDRKELIIEIRKLWDRVLLNEEQKCRKRKS